VVLGKTKHIPKVPQNTLLKRLAMITLILKHSTSCSQQCFTIDVVSFWTPTVLQREMEDDVKTFTTHKQSCTTTMHLLKYTDISLKILQVKTE
jgi:hypothetical protein